MRIDRFMEYMKKYSRKYSREERSVKIRIHEYIYKYKNKDTSEIIEAIKLDVSDKFKFTPTEKEIKVFCEGSDLFEKGLITFKNSVKMIKEVDLSSKVYSIIFNENNKKNVPSLYNPSFLIEDEYIILRKIIKKEESKKFLLVWSVPFHIAVHIFDIIKKENK